MRTFRTLIGVLALVLLAVVQARAQDEKEPDKEKQPEKEKQAEKDKQAMERLLQKAEDEYRFFFKRPEKVHEFWAAVKFEMNVGKFDLAALHLKQLLAKEPAEEVDKDLVRIEEAEGMSAFLRLQAVKKWSDIAGFHKESEENVQKLVNRVTTSLEKHLSDPVRLGKLIAQLDAPTIQERSYALVQLNRSRAQAAPYLIKALRDNADGPLRRRVVEVLLKMDRDVVPGFLEVLRARNPRDAADPDLRLTLLDIIKARADARAVPYLWHLSASPQYPLLVRSRAKELLASFLQEDPEKLPPAHLALTHQAERYYRHKVKFIDPRGVTVWPWDGRSIDAKPTVLTARQAEQYFGLRHAREALDLAPTYKPAQAVFINLMLEHHFAPELDQSALQKMPAAVKNLLASVDAESLIGVLDQALEDGNPRVALATVQVLGERGEVRAATLSYAGAPRGLLKALYYPDRRVQMAAARAMVRLPPSPVPLAATRVVDILRRFLAADGGPKALVAYTPASQAKVVHQTVKEAGFEPVLVSNVKEAFEHLNRAADFDVILVFPNAPPSELPYVLTQLREDRDAARLPLLVFADAKNEEGLTQMVRHHPHTRVVPQALAAMPEELKSTIDRRIKDASGAALSAKEREEFRKVAMDLLWRMARGEISGYHVLAARAAVVQAVGSKDLGVEAVEILGRLPGTESQHRLAGIVLDPSREKLRLTAARELNRHLQKFGLLLTTQQMKDLRAAYRNPAEEPDLRAQLALVMGSLRPTSLQTGNRLFEFRPDPPAQKKE